ncbi:Flp family type IVb pilin [Kangsaoukella pontilimi]|uniref:Flp family type IVb pilin n=1 Tax=Kangsaoukella pontilimi TaxID=2691042 RepID=UPI001D0B459F|nr:hypothetical protein [Kangsaoukella pontilimi]
MRDLFMNFAKDEGGATLVEYGVALIVAILVGGTTLSLLGADVQANVNGGCAALDYGTVGTDGSITGAGDATC